MPNRQFDRRRVLTFGTVGALGFWTAPAFGAARQPDPNADRPPLQFSAVIPGCLEASKNIREISIDELLISPRQTVTGRDNEFWSTGPSSASMAPARFTLTGSPGAGKELQAWFQEAAKGKSIRKNITVTLHRAQKPTRTFTLMDCFPVSFSYVNFDTSSTVQTETLTVSVGRIEFKT